MTEYRLLDENLLNDLNDAFQNACPWKIDYRIGFSVNDYEIIDTVKYVVKGKILYFFIGLKSKETNNDYWGVGIVPQAPNTWEMLWKTYKKADYDNFPQVLENL